MQTEQKDGNDPRPRDTTHDEIEYGDLNRQQVLALTNLGSELDSLMRKYDGHQLPGFLALRAITGHLAVLPFRAECVPYLQALDGLALVQSRECLEAVDSRLREFKANHGQAEGVRAGYPKEALTPTSICVTVSGISGRKKTLDIDSTTRLPQMKEFIQHKLELPSGEQEIAHYRNGRMFKWLPKRGESTLGELDVRSGDHLSVVYRS